MSGIRHIFSIFVDFIAAALSGSKRAKKCGAESKPLFSAWLSFFCYVIQGYFYTLGWGLLNCDPYTSCLFILFVLGDQMKLLLLDFRLRW
jgi:hypothetical protein